jgi:tetratricopeptide (TPR) repeat protein
MRSAAVAAMVLMILAVFPAQGVGQELHCKDPALAADAREFGNALFDEGDFFRAATEYKRFVFLCQSSPNVATVELKLGKTYAAAGRWDDALSALRGVIERFPDAPESSEADLNICKVYLDRSEFARAEECFARTLNREDQNRRSATARLFLETLIYEGKFDKAVDSLSLGFPIATSAELEDSVRRRLNAYVDVPSKSPLVAGLLSASVPGSGQAYDGRVRDGILALFLNTLFAFGTYEAVSHDLKVVGGTVAFFGFAWYTGGIFGAVNSAERFNQSARDAFVREVLEGWGWRNLERKQDKWK